MPIRTIATAIALIACAALPAAASPVATIEVTDGSIGYAADANGEVLTVAGSFRAAFDPSFDLDEVNRYTIFAELTASIDGSDPVPFAEWSKTTLPTTLRALLGEAMDTTLGRGGAVVGADGASEDPGGSVFGASGGATLGELVADDDLSGARAGAAIGAGVAVREKLEPPAGSDPAPTVVEDDLIDRILAIVADPDPTPRPLVDDLLLGFGYDHVDAGPDLVAGRFQALLRTDRPGDRLDPGFEAARLDLDLEISVAAMPLPAGLPMLAIGVLAVGVLARRRT